MFKYIGEIARVKSVSIAEHRNFLKIIAAIIAEFVGHPCGVLS
jgi:hypothetical protein